MSEDMREMAEAVLPVLRIIAKAEDPTIRMRAQEVADMAAHVLATEARLDVALRGAFQSREEMREWLGSHEAREELQEAIWRGLDARGILDALMAAMPGGDA